ncbi:MAG: hypothetical protein HF967_09400 [Methanosarcinales archaeon]|jgi:membrane-bound hydrogenase subunit beta|nr:hypothetical protein [Methanosarcinales archaeon]
MINIKELCEEFKNEFGEYITQTRIGIKKVGKNEHKLKRLWIHISNKKIKNAINFLLKFQENLHISTISGRDVGNEIEIIYFITIQYGLVKKDIVIALVTRVSKDNPKIQTITDIIPGAILYEKEVREMLGVTIENLNDDAKFVLPDDFPENLYPLRLDESGISDTHPLVNNAPFIKKGEGKK